MKYIVANFKTNKNLVEYDQYFDSLKLINFENFYTYFFVNSLYILQLKNNFPMFNIGIQSVSSLKNGSYTSSFSIQQLVDEHINSILLGHSEEFKYFNETLNNVNLKLSKCLENNIKCFVCFGNEKEFYNVEKIVEELSKILNIILKNINRNFMQNIVLAYEPIYAIDTQNNADPILVNNVISKLKTNLKTQYSFDFQILYGGSVTLFNYKDYLKQEFIDGILIGKEILNVKNLVEMSKYNGQ